MIKHKRLLLVLFLVIIIEPITTFIIYPFVYFMVKDFHLSDDDRDIGFYAGFLAASFSMAQFLTSIPWGYLSRIIGGKTVILFGLAGNLITSILFGFSRSYTWAITARTVCGLLNGNIAVAKIIIGQISDDETQNFAFSIFGFSFGLGGVLASFLGGVLAQPFEKYPDVFGSMPIFKNYPYLLPCLVSSLFALCGLVLGIFLMEETLLGNSATEQICVDGDVQTDINECETSEESRLLTRKSVSKINYDSLNEIDDDDDLEAASIYEETSVFKASSVTISLYAFLAFSQIVFQEAYVLWCNADTKFGGLGWSTSQVGYSMAANGGMLILIQVFIFQPMQRLRGNVRLFRDGMLLCVPIYFLTGWLSLIHSPTWLWAATLTLHFFRSLFQCWSFNTIGIMINNSATLETLGLVNGISQSLASLVRAIGPALGGVIWQFSLKANLVYPLNYQLVFILCSVSSLIGWAVSSQCPKHVESVRKRQK